MVTLTQTLRIENIVFFCRVSVKCGHDDGKISDHLFFNQKSQKLIASTFRADFLTYSKKGGYLIGKKTDKKVGKILTGKN